jgi:hypothetical protein
MDGDGECSSPTGRAPGLLPLFGPSPAVSPSSPHGPPGHRYILHASAVTDVLCSIGVRAWTGGEPRGQAEAAQRGEPQAVRRAGRHPRRPPPPARPRHVADAELPRARAGRSGGRQRDGGAAAQGQDGVRARRAVGRRRQPPQGRLPVAQVRPEGDARQPVPEGLLPLRVRSLLRRQEEGKRLANLHFIPSAGFLILQNHADLLKFSPS